MPTLTWSLATDPGADGGNATCVAYSPALDLWVVGGDDAGFLTSSDTTTWTQVTPAFNFIASDVVWADTLGLFVAVGFNYSDFTEVVCTSPDGSTWTLQTTPWDGTGNADGVAWSHDLGQLLLCGNSNGSSPAACFLTSPDGVTWTERHSTFDDGFARNAEWSSDLTLWVAAGKGPGSPADVILTSPDGVTWTSRRNSYEQASDVSWSHELGLFAVTLSSTAGGTAILTSPDGTTWTARTGSGFDGGSVGAQAVAWSSTLGLFVVVAANSSTFATSPDGATWTNTGALAFLGWDVETHGSEIVVAGADWPGETTSRIMLGVPVASGGRHIASRF